jgi:hypothetical protein
MVVLIPVALATVAVMETVDRVMGMGADLATGVATSRQICSRVLLTKSP